MSPLRSPVARWMHALTVTNVAAAHGPRFAVDEDRNMEGTRHRASTLSLPTAAQSDRAERDARALFGRSLACWASDVLALQQTERDRLTWGARGDHDHVWEHVSKMAA